MTKREVIIPFSREAEEYLLSACLQSTNAIDTVGEMVESDDFYFPSHGALFSQMVEAHLAGEAVDAATMAAKGADANFVAHLIGLPALVSYGTDYARTVASLATRRRIMQAGQRIAEMAANETDAEKLSDAAEELIYGMRRHDKGEPVFLRDLLRDAETRIDEAHEGKARHMVRTELGGLDDIITGFSPGTYNIIAARPSVGKTALAMQIARNIANEHRVVVFSVEMTREELVDRLLSSESKVPLTNLRTGKVSDAEQVYLHNAVAALARTHLIIDDSAATMADIVRRTRRLAAQAPLGLVVIDYIQLLHLDRGKPNENYVREVAEISRRIKLAARDFNVPILALSQLSRPEKRYDDTGNAARPNLAALRDSGALEQDADMVLFIHRPQAESPEVELIVAKQRNGPTGKVVMHFVPHTVSFYGT